MTRCVYKSVHEGGGRCGNDVTTQRNRNVCIIAILYDAARDHEAA
jgi:hypothetical protein